MPLAANANHELSPLASTLSRWDQLAPSHRHRLLQQLVCAHSTHERLAICDAQHLARAYGASLCSLAVLKMTSWLRLTYQFPTDLRAPSSLRAQHIELEQAIQAQQQAQAQLESRVGGEPGGTSRSSAMRPLATPTVPVLPPTPPLPVNYTSLYLQLRALSVFLCAQEGEAERAATRLFHDPLLSPSTHSWCEQFTSSGGCTLLLSTIQHLLGSESQSQQQLDQGKDKRMEGTGKPVNPAPSTSPPTTTNTTTPSASPSSSSLSSSPLSLSSALLCTEILVQLCNCAGNGVRELICDAHGVPILLTLLLHPSLPPHTPSLQHLFVSLAYSNQANLLHEELVAKYHVHQRASVRRKLALGSILIELLTPSPSPTTPLYTPDAKYIDAALSLLHIPSLELHAQISSLLLLLLRHEQLWEPLIQALLILLKTKPSTLAALRAQYSAHVIDDTVSVIQQGAHSKAVSTTAPTSPSYASINDDDDPQSNKLSCDPKLTAMQVLRSMVQSKIGTNGRAAYDLAQRLLAAGFFPVLLECLCDRHNYEVQLSSALLLYTSHRLLAGNGIHEDPTGSELERAPSTPLLRYVLGSKLYTHLLRQPHTLHKQLGVQEIGAIQASLTNPSVNLSALLSQKRMERRQHSIARRASVNMSARASMQSDAINARGSMGMDMGGNRGSMAGNRSSMTGNNRSSLAGNRGSVARSSMDERTMALNFAAVQQLLKDRAVSPAPAQAIVSQKAGPTLAVPGAAAGTTNSLNVSGSTTTIPSALSIPVSPAAGDNVSATAAGGAGVHHAASMFHFQLADPGAAQAHAELAARAMHRLADQQGQQTNTSLGVNIGVGVGEESKQNDRSAHISVLSDTPDPNHNALQIDLSAAASFISSPVHGMPHAQAVQLSIEEMDEAFFK